MKDIVRNKILLIIAGLLIILFFVFFENKILPSFINNKSDENKTFNKPSENLPNINNFDLNGNSKAPIIDQSIIGSRDINLGGKSLESILGSVDEEVEVEVMLIDGEKNQSLTNYVFEYRFIEKPGGETIKLKTNAEGKFKITVNRARSIPFVVSTKDYADSFCRLNLVYGKNKCNVFLYVGSIIEIKATDQNGKIIFDLKAFQVIRHLNGDITTESIPINFDDKLKLYFISKISIGRQELCFIAKGYQSSSLYTVNVLSKAPNKLGVILTKPRKILFDLNLNMKPEFIYITKPKVLHKDGLIFDEYTDKVFKNKSGLYEFELKDYHLTKLVLITENYLPKTVDLISGQDIFFVSFSNDFKMKLKIINQKGEPIPDAVINYTITKHGEDYREIHYDALKENSDSSSKGSASFFIKGIDRTSISDANGNSLLSGLHLQNNISILITHKNYADFIEELWHIDNEEASEKTVILKDPKSICGKIKYNGINVAGAKVFLYQYQYPTIYSHSGADGSYCFKKLNEIDEISFCQLIAFHHDYGFAEITDLKTDQKDQEIDINLKRELSLSVKVEDINGIALSNKKVVLKARLPYLCNQKEPLEYCAMTDFDGKCQVFNMPHFEFNMFVEDEFFGKGAFVTTDIPLIDFVFKVEKNNLKKITSIDSNGKPITKKIIAKGYDYDGNTQIIDTLFINNEQYLELANNDYSNSGHNQGNFERIMFQLPEFANIYFDTKVALGKIPDEIHLKFQKGFNLKVKIVSAQDEMPLSRVNVYLTSIEKRSYYDFAEKNEVSHSLSTNESGEANFTCLNGEYLLEVCDPNFTYYSYDVNVIDNSEILIGLKRGGILKAYFNFPKNFKKAELYFQHNNLIATNKLMATVDSAKDFEVYNIIPGTYVVNVTLYFNDNEFETIKFPTKIIIENNKTHEINLDDLLKNKTSLTIIPLNQDNTPIPDALFKLYIGNKYQLEDFYQGQIFNSNERGEIKLSLLPNINYYGVLEVNANYQMQIIEPFELKSGQNKTIEVFLSNSRKLNKIQVVDVDGNPIEGASFIYKNKSGKIYVPHGDIDLEMQPFTNEYGFFTDISWPNDEFNLIVSCFGFEFKEITIPENQSPNQLIQIKLNYDSSIQCDFSHILSSPISVGVLNDKGELLQQVILQNSYKKRLPDGNLRDFELPNYRSNIRMGSQTFSNLAAGTYYIGYFKDGTKELIYKQGPFTLGMEENLVVKSDYALKEK